MKKLILLAVFAVSAVSASAQMLPKIGLRAGVNIAKLRTAGENRSSSTENLTNFKVGGYVDFGLAGGLSFQPGIELSGKGGKNSFANSGTSYQETVNLLYVEIPINILYNIPVGIGKIYLGGGPYAAFGISGKYKQEGSVLIGGDGVANVNTDRKVNFGTNNGDDYKNTDFGLNFLGGLQFKGGLNLGVNYGLGLSDLAPNNNDNNIKTNNRLVGITAGYFF